MKKALRLFCFLLCAGLMLALAVTTSSASRITAAPAVDGDGVVTVSPTQATYGSGISTFTFTFTANADFIAGSQVKIDIPAGWTAPTLAAGAGHISWNSRNLPTVRRAPGSG